jgi:hypothetical protein
MISWERLINNIEFLYEKLKKNLNFKKSIYYSLICKIKSTHLYKNINDTRKYNDHDLSRHYDMFKELSLEEILLSNDFDKNLESYVIDNIMNVDVIIDCLIELILSISERLLDIYNTCKIPNTLHYDLRNDDTIFEYIKDKDAIDIALIEDVYHFGVNLIFRTQDLGRFIIEKPISAFY